MKETKLRLSKHHITGGFITILGLTLQLTVTPMPIVILVSMLGVSWMVFGGVVVKRIRRADSDSFVGRTMTGIAEIKKRTNKYYDPIFEIFKI